MKLTIKRRGTRENKNIKIEENKKKDNVLFPLSICNRNLTKLNRDSLREHRSFIQLEK